MKNFHSELLIYQNDLDKQKSTPTRNENDKNMYDQYLDKTSGLDGGFTKLEFGQSTNPTKSKFDNVIGWVKLGK